MKSMLLSKFRFTALITVVALFMTFAVPLLVEVNTVEATPSARYITPYTRYYYCPSGLSGSESGTYDQTVSPPSDQHYGELYWVIPPSVPGAYWVRPHIDHGDPETHYNSPVTEYEYLDRDHWRCR